MKFEILAGKHYDGDGKAHKKGKIIDSDTNLEATFANKFKRRKDLELLEKRGLAAHVDDEGNISEEPAKKKKDSKPAILNKPVVPKALAEDDEDEDEGDEISAGADQDDDEDDEDEEKAAAEDAPADEPVKKDKNKDDEKPTLVVSKLGRDVTEGFPEAVLAEFAVLKDRKGLYYVVAPDNANSPLHPKPVAKSQVNKMVKQLTS